MERFVLVLALLATGCFFDTSSDIPFGQIEETETTEYAALFSDEDLPSGDTCGHTALVGASCDPVLQNCAPGDYCELTIESQNRARAVCKPMPETAMNRRAGQPCNTTDQRCAVGFFCNGNVCRRYCDIETGLACEPTEVCDAPFNGTHGLCVDSCR